MSGFSGNSDKSTYVQDNTGFSRTSAIDSSKPRWFRYCCAGAVSSRLRALWVSKGLWFKYLSSWVSWGSCVTTHSPMCTLILSGSTNLESKHRNSSWNCYPLASLKIFSPCLHVLLEPMQKLLALFKYCEKFTFLRRERYMLIFPSTSESIQMFCPVVKHAALMEC